MDPFEPRKYVIQALVILFGLLYVGRLFYLQVMDESLKMQASDIGKRTIYPARGLIFDRHGKLIVGNKPIYDLLVVQRQVGKMDTAQFCKLLGINDSIFKARMERLTAEPWRYSPRKPEPFLTQIDYETFARFEEHLHEFPGFYPQVKMVRTYPYGSAAHVVGDIGEVSKEERERYGYYDLGEYIGKSGLESYYEEALRGTKGVNYYLKDNIGRDLGPFQGGAFDTMAHAGQNLLSTLDIELQRYGEKLMQNKRGSIVAIEPSTGEVLAFISSPSYDPNLLVGRERGTNYKVLVADTVNDPLINRPLTAIYPPGSTFKPIMGLISIQEGAIGLNTTYPCSGGYFAGGISVGCHHHAAIHNFNEAIQHSCNAWFCNSLAKLLESNHFDNESEAVNRWAKYLHEFNLGEPTHIDLPGEGGGNIPTGDSYDKLYKGWRWRASTVISIAIGQGEVTVTPLQLANLYAILANRGTYFSPHLAKAFEGDSVLLTEYRESHTVSIDTALFNYIPEGMENVVKAGTARLAQIDSISVCGKTGTAENPHGEDHSIFAAYAPRNEPKIAIAVVVENSGFGGTWAAPIASLMIEYYIKRKIGEKRKWQEDRILNANFIDQP